MAAGSVAGTGLNSEFAHHLQVSSWSEGLYDLVARQRMVPLSRSDAKGSVGGLAGSQDRRGV